MDGSGKKHCVIIIFRPFPGHVRHYVMPRSKLCLLIKNAVPYHNTFGCSLKLFVEDDCRTHGCEKHYNCEILNGRYTCVYQSDNKNTTEVTGQSLHFIIIIILFSIIIFL